MRAGVGGWRRRLLAAPCRIWDLRIAACISNLFRSFLLTPFPRGGTSSSFYFPSFLFLSFPSFPRPLSKDGAQVKLPFDAIRSSSLAGCRAGGAYHWPLCSLGRNVPLLVTALQQQQPRLWAGGKAGRESEGGRVEGERARSSLQAAK